MPVSMHANEVGEKQKPSGFKQQEFQTDRAKDKAYMEYREKADEAADVLEAKGISLENISAFDHKSRQDILGENLKNYTPSMFVLNPSAEKQI
jgi:hypothetical protein